MTKTLIETGWQTVGPFFHSALPWKNGGLLAKPGAQGERIRIRGLVLDVQRQPVGDAMVEVWQANSAGKYRHPEDLQAKPLDPAFDGFGRVVVDPSGNFEIDTIRPGSTPGPGNTLQAPHIVVSVFARGLVRRLVTRMYFAGDPANQNDPVLAMIEDEARRRTLMAERDPSDITLWTWTIRLRGDDETVFFQL